MAILLASLATAIGITVDLRLAFVGVAGLLAAATLHTRAWLPLVGISLTGLVVLASGFNNIPFPLGGLTIPLVDAVLLYALIATGPLWWRLAARSTLGRRLLVLLLLLTAVATLRLLFDFPTYGVTAGRDAL
jgi:hypothetical protein